MERRLESDLQLLYGLRNAAVHRGRRVLGRSMTMYLGQLGAEILLSVMDTRATALRVSR